MRTAAFWPLPEGARASNDKGWDNPEYTYTTWLFDGNKIVTTDLNGKSGLLHVTYFKVGELIFADTIVNKLEGINWHQAIHFIDGHLVFRIELEGNRLITRPLSKKWFDEFTQEHHFAGDVVDTDAREYTTLVINASPQEWIDFLGKYGTDEEAFPKETYPTTNARVLIRQVDEEEDD